MDLKDPVSARFQPLIESLMKSATQEMIKLFARVVKESQEELTRGRREIESLKQQLRRSEPRCPVLKAQVTIDLKSEEEEAEVAHSSPQAEDLPGTRSEVVGSSAENVPSESRGETGGTPGSSSLADVSGEREPSSTCTKAVEQQSQPETGEPCGSPPRTPPAASSQPSNTPAASCQRNEAESQQAGTNGRAKRKYIKKKYPSLGLSRSLRARTRRVLPSRCTCCSAGECFQGSSGFLKTPQAPLRPKPPRDDKLFKCSECQTAFKGWLAFKKHKCPANTTCMSCGATFSSARALSRHTFWRLDTRRAPFSCTFCGVKFPSNCSWLAHQRLHTGTGRSQPGPRDLQTTTTTTPATTLALYSALPKELKANVAVRLERMSDTKLRAALAFKGSSLPASNTRAADSASPSSSVPECEASSEPLADGNLPVTGGGLSAPAPSRAEAEGSCLAKVTVESQDPNAAASSVLVIRGTAGIPISPFACPNQQRNSLNETPLFSSVNVQAGSPVKEERSHDLGGPASQTQEGTTCSSPPEKRLKMAECTHDFNGGVFPVERILKTRNNKGLDEVRVKWMPCSACGAKWKNTWEPAESFTTLLNDKK